MIRCERTARRRRDRPPGFTLIEIVVVLAVVATIVALLAPMVFRQLTTARENSTITEVATIYRAIIGDQKTTFGYVGDVDAYPTSLLDLVRAPAGPPAGWRGPYLSATPSPVSNQLVDQFGNAYEFFLKVAATTTADTLAIISRGPDGNSTNTSATPNTAADFTTSPQGPPAPTTNTYLSTTVSSVAVNNDNIVVPFLDSANNSALLQESTYGTFAPTIMNFDSNTFVNTLVPACPGLYTIKQTSVPRGGTAASDTYTRGFGVSLRQGSWQLAVTTPLATDPLYTQVVTLQPNTTLSPNITFSSLNSSNTTTFNLTVTNKSATSQSITVYVSNVAAGGLISPGASLTQLVKACAPVQIQNVTAGGVVVDQFTMPYQAYTRLVLAGTVQLTVTNSGVRPDLKVLDQGLQLARVSSGLSATVTVINGDTIAITDDSDAALTGGSFTITTTITKTCTTTSCT